MTNKRPFCPIINDSCNRECVFRDIHSSSKSCAILQFFEDTHKIADEVNTNSVVNKLDDIKTSLQYLR